MPIHLTLSLYDIISHSTSFPDFENGTLKPSEFRRKLIREIFQLLMKINVLFNEIAKYIDSILYLLVKLKYQMYHHDCVLKHLQLLFGNQ